MAPQTPIAEVIKDIQSDIKKIVAGEIALAKAELLPQAKKAGAGAGLFGAAGAFALGAVTVINLGLALLSGAIMSNWLEPRWAYPVGFAIWAVILLVLAGIFALVGKLLMKFTKPQRTIDTAEKSVVAVRGAIESGQAQVKRMPLLGGPKE